MDGMNRQSQGVRPLPEGHESKERNIREHLELRLRFAEAVSEKKGMPLAAALAEYTDAHVRITGKFAEAGSVSPQWSECAAQLADGDHEARLQTLIEFYKKNQTEHKDHTNDAYWPLRYDYIANEQLVDLHFGSADFNRITDEPGFLSSAREQEMLGKLKEMFSEIRRAHPDAKAVGCRTWLFNRPGFLRLFPSSFTPKEPSLGKFKGGGRWGQFYEGSGKVNISQRDAFVENIRHLDPDNLEAAFPSKTYEVVADIGEFYKKYGIE